jgi:flagellar hook-associated protein 3 FlgL
LANTSSGNLYVFGGENSTTPPLSNYSTTPPSNAQLAIDQAFNTTFGFEPASAQASTITPSAMQSFLDGPFAAQFTGTNWTTNWSSASSVNTTAEIAPGETVQTSSNANEPGFKQLAQAFTMLTEFSGSALSASTLQVVVSAATTLATQGVSSMTTTEAGVGSALSQVTQANASMASQMTILQTQIGNLDDVDANSVALQLNTLTTQLQTAYQLTAQLQKISLAQYLPT